MEITDKIYPIIAIILVAVVGIYFWSTPNPIIIPPTECGNKALNPPDCDKFSPDPPPVPIGLSVIPISSSKIHLAWNEVTGATSYNIYKSLTSTGTFTHVGTPSTNSYDSNGNSAGTKYYFQVSAENSAGEGLKSTIISATTKEGSPTNCLNGANNFPTCTTFDPCLNGATNPPTCNNQCTNGATNPPACNNQCPIVTTVCQYGHTLDSRGCETNTCNLPPDPNSRRLMHSPYTTTSTAEVINVIKKHYCGNHFDVISDDKAATGPFLYSCKNSLGQYTYDYRASIIGVSLGSMSTKQQHALKYHFGAEDIVLYDLESSPTWPSPQSEKDDPVGSVYKACDIIHNFVRYDGGRGYKCGIDWDGKFWLEHWDDIDYRKADMANIQMQRYSRNDNGILISTIKKMSDRAKSQNSNIQVFIQISFRQSANNYDNNQALDVTQSMNNLKKTIDELAKVPSVDGVRIVYLPEVTNTCDPRLCNPQNLDAILTYIEGKKK